MSKSLTIFREMGIRNRQPEVLNGLARVAIARGEYEQAQTLLTESLAVTQDNGNVAQQASTLHLWGILKLHEGNSHEAAQYYTEALKITSRIKAAPLTLAICLSVARLYLPPYGNKLQQATDLLHLVLAHPATEAIVREQARNLIAEFDPPAAQEIENLWTAVTQVDNDLMRL